MLYILQNKKLLVFWTVIFFSLGKNSYDSHSAYNPNKISSTESHAENKYYLDDLLENPQNNVEQKTKKGELEKSKKEASMCITQR